MRSPDSNKIPTKFCSTIKTTIVSCTAESKSAIDICLDDDDDVVVVVVVAVIGARRADKDNGDGDRGVHEWVK